MRTVLNAMVKCLFSILFVTIHFVIKVVKKDSYERIDPESVSVNNDLRESSEDTESAALAASSDPRVSLLGPLPHYYSGVSNKSSASKKSKYI